MEPKIRFKGFEGEWKTSTIGEIAPLSGGYAFQSNHFSSVGIPIVRISNILETGIVGGVFAKYAPFDGDADFRLYDGDAVIAMSGATTGKVAIVHTQGFLYQNQRVGKFTKTDRVIYDFLTTIVKSHKFRADLSCLLTSSAQPNASSKDIDSITQSIPLDKDEQQAIGKYFTSLDSQISASTSRLASLKQMKAASLQAMFPQEGETVPKIRFKGFEGEWKKVSFKDFTFHAGTKNRDNLPLESYSISNEFGFIPQNEQFENGGTMTQADKRMYYIVSPNSFAYNPARINVGSLGYYEGKEDVIVSSLYEVFKTDDTICDKFLLYWFKTDIFQKMIEQFQEGGVRLYFFYDKMCKCSLMRPSLAEQQAIASYFTSLDRQISLQSQRLEKLKQIKSACLDKMFV